MPLMHPPLFDLSDLQLKDPPPPPARPQLQRRCRDCGYILEHLPPGNCPECGHPYDPKRRETWSFHEPKNALRVWMPGLTFALAAGLIVAWLAWNGNALRSGLIGGGFAVIVFFGYARVVRQWRLLLTTSFVLFCLIFALRNASPHGFFESVVNFVAVLLILAVPYSLGAMLRRTLAGSTWSQAIYLP